MRQLTDLVNHYTKDLIDNIALDERKLSILKAQYYDYALENTASSAFGNAAADVFAVYRERVDHHFQKYHTSTVLRLKAIEDKITSDNPKYISQAVTTCRRLFQTLPKNYLTDISLTIRTVPYKTKSWKIH